MTSMLDHHQIETASCVYSLVNQATGQQYIGSTINLRQRIAAHRSGLRNGVHKSHLLQEAARTYGLRAFAVLILERIADVEMLVARETYYIELLAPAYNAAPTGGSAKGRLVSAETRARMSATHKGVPKSPAQIAKVGAALRGYKHSDEARAHMSQGQRKRAYASEALRAKRSENQRRRMQDPEYRQRLTEQVRGWQFGRDGQKGGAA